MLLSPDLSCAPRGRQECLVIQLAVGDSAQMLVGRSMGRHYACPTISPKKTYEGLDAGVGVFGRVSLDLANWL